MREALSAIRAELGADAVMLSTRKLPNGVEVIAAIDYDDSLFPRLSPAVKAAAAPRGRPDLDDEKKGGSDDEDGDFDRDEDDEDDDDEDEDEERHDEDDDERDRAYGRRAGGFARYCFESASVLGGVTLSGSMRTIR